MEPPARWPGGHTRMVAVAGGDVAVETVWSTGRTLPPFFMPALVMLHGWTLDRRMWLPQMPLAAHFNLVGIDRRGFGQSTAPADSAAEPGDVLRVADALELERFHLLGMSQGGRTALALAARAPGRLLSLTLQGTALDGVAAPAEGVPVAEMAAAARRGDLAAVRGLVRDHALMRVGADSQMVSAMLADYDARDLMAAGGGLPVTADLVTGAAFPVTAIVGENDTAQRLANARALAAAGATMVTVPSAGHLCNIDNPGRFNAALRAALVP